MNKLVTQPSDAIRKPSTVKCRPTKITCNPRSLDQTTVMDYQLKLALLALFLICAVNGLPRDESE